MFRLSNIIIDQYTKNRRHQKLSQLVTNTNTFDISYEKQNSEDADSVYKSWTAYIISKTRDVHEFPLIFKENMSYGFRRNLWGLKPAALVVISLLIIGTYLYFGIFFSMWELMLMPSNFFITEIVLTAFLLFWLIIVTKKWVSIPAFAYAARLHEAIEKI